VKVYVKGTGTTVDLTQRDFVAQGGQGQIFTKNGTAYKIYHDPANMLPEGKIQELQAITDPRVNKPQQILVNKAGKPIGYTTKFVKDAYALCQLFPKSFRDREKVTHEMMQELVRKFQEGVSNVHKAGNGYLIVDANELNFLVPHDFSDVIFIDVDSYQTPHYKAPVLMDSVRDWTVHHNDWTQDSDWYSFGIVSFQMFVGIHPYKGQYHGSHQEFKTKLATDPDDDAFAVTRRRMQHNVSVFHQDVKVPGAVYPFSVIPTGYRAWYEAMFVQGKRCAPPTAFGQTFVLMPVIKTMTGTALLDITEIREYEGNVTQIWGDGSQLVVLTDKGVWLDSARIPVTTKAVSACGFSPRGGKPVLVARGLAGVPIMTNLTDRLTVPFSLAADQISATNGRIYVRSADQVHEVVLTDAGTQVVASTRAAVNILPHATKLYPGVVIQNMLGSVYVSLLSAAGVARQILVKELSNYKVLDAKYDGGVLMVIGAPKGKGAKYDRLVFRFDQDTDAYDLRVVPDVAMGSLNFVTLDSGVCVCLNEEEKLELFSSRKGSTGMKYIDDPSLGSDMILGKQGGTVLFARGNKVYKMRMK